MNNQTDGELVRQARTGNKAAFSQLIERYTLMVERIAYRIMGDAEVAHDLTQEAWLQAYLSLENLKSETSFRSWLYGLTLNVCRAYLRSLRHNVYSLETMLGGIHRDPGPTPEEIVERLELRDMARGAVETLSRANRTAVLLVYYEDFTPREAATILGISDTALKARLFRSRRQLETTLASLIHIPAKQQGVFNMIPVKVVDVWRKKAVINSDVQAVWMQVILYDEEGHRALVIWVGESEGFAILHGLTNYDAPRPMTQTFIARLLQAADAEVEYVLISALKNETYYATVRVRSGEQVRDVDARPSDALGLALEMDVPIYVSAEVLQQTGRPIPAGHAPTGKGMASIEEHWRVQQECWDEEREAKSEQQISKEEQDILAAAFG